MLFSFYFTDSICPSVVQLQKFVLTSNEYRRLLPALLAAAERHDIGWSSAVSRDLFTPSFLSTCSTADRTHLATLLGLYDGTNSDSDWWQSAVDTLSADASANVRAACMHALGVAVQRSSSTWSFISSRLAFDDARVGVRQAAWWAAANLGERLSRDQIETISWLYAAVGRAQDFDASTVRCACALLLLQTDVDLSLVSLLRTQLSNGTSAKTRWTAAQAACAALPALSHAISSDVWCEWTRAVVAAVCGAEHAKTVQFAVQALVAIAIDEGLAKRPPMSELGVAERLLDAVDVLGERLKSATFQSYGATQRVQRAVVAVIVRTSSVSIGRVAFWAAVDAIAASHPSMLLVCFFVSLLWYSFCL